MMLSSCININQAVVSLLFVFQTRQIIDRKDLCNLYSGETKKSESCDPDFLISHQSMVFLSFSISG